MKGGEDQRLVTRKALYENVRIFVHGIWLGSEEEVKEEAAEALGCLDGLYALACSTIGAVDE